MATTTAISFTTPIRDVPLAERHAEAFERLGIHNAADLLRHVPLRYEHLRAEQTIDDAYRTSSEHHNTEVNLALRGEIAVIRTAAGRSGKGRTEATLEDGTGTVRVVWFNVPWMRKKLHPGTQVLVQGKAKRKGDYLEMVNPSVSIVDEQHHRPTVEARIQPIYPASEELPSKTIEKVLAKNLDALIALIEDHLPAAYRAQRALPTLAETYRFAHRPESDTDIATARRRLAFDELLLLQLGVAMRKHAIQGAATAAPIMVTPTLRQRILGRLPFALTRGQEEAVAEITSDLARAIPMNRLLQGDVGSGKTAVAAYAMLAAVAKKHQAALMAPTELLAEQHESVLRDMLKDSSVRLALLTGALKPKERAARLAELASGDIDIVIGTHALLAEKVRFKSLALVVIDEQHRFGVEQRAALRQVGEISGLHPHTLVMTATPIPRTLSLTIFGDLDVSTITGLPPGRARVHTRVVPSVKTDEVYAYIAERLRSAEQNEQAYVVVPAVDDSALGLKDVVSHAERLTRGHFAGLPVGTLHGRMDRDEREAVIRGFREGRYKALVATTVIEVGVDVPAATMIVIEHAERFGLAQLHQLRGRIGRRDESRSQHASKPVLCVLIADPTTPDAEERLKAIAATTDGFEIAEQDLLIRGPGELFGSRQSGLAPFRAVEFPRDLELLNLARHDALSWIESSPTLSLPEEKLLRQRLMKAHGKGLGLGDVG